MAQLVEHVLGKDEVTGSIPVVGSSFLNCKETAEEKKNGRYYKTRNNKPLASHPKEASRWQKRNL